MKLVLYPDVDIWNFVLSGIEHRSDVLLYPLSRHCNIIQNAIRKWGQVSFIPASFVLGADIRKAISELSRGDSLIIAEYTDSSLIYTISKIIPEGVSRYIWLWNHKGRDIKFSKNLSVITEHHFQVITYDELDAEMYGFRWHTQFFNISTYKSQINQQIDISYDFLFVGYAKNRMSEIEKIRSLLASYSCQFITVSHLSDYVPYAKYMEMAIHSRCIVEIVHTGDASCTLRPLEALAIHRKLITNNPAVRRYSFYRPSNIFIIGEDDITYLQEFLESPYEPLPDEIVDSYDVNSWVDSF